MAKKITNFIALKKNQRYHLKQGVVEVDGRRITLHQVDFTVHNVDYFVNRCTVALYPDTTYQPLADIVWAECEIWSID